MTRLNWLRFPAFILLVWTLAVPVAVPAQKKDKKNDGQDVTERERNVRPELKKVYKDWINEDVAYIITSEERRAFNRLATDEERERFQDFLDHGFVDTFRHLHPDTTGAYTWWNLMSKARERNTGWRIDYFLVSRALTPNLAGAAIHPDVLGSDHCPVSIELAGL